MTRAARNPERQKGYALILVLWSLMVLSLLAAMIISQNRFAVRAEANAWTALEADETAEAAFAIAVLKLYDPLTHRDGLFHGASVPFEFDGVQGEIIIQDELGKVDINTANDQTLRILLRAADASPSETEVLASRIIEWRDSRHERRPFAVVKEEYEKERVPYAPRGAAFQSVNELRLVLGLDEDLFEKLRPAITIYTHSTTFDPAAAPEVLRRAAVARPERKDNEARSRIPIEGRAFTLAAVFETGGVRRDHEKIVRFVGDGANPVWIHEWRD